MRATCRVRSRSTAAAGAVHVRVRAMACRSSADSDTPAATALARQSASSGGDTRAEAVTVRRSAIRTRRQAGRGASPPPADALELLPERGRRPSIAVGQSAFYLGAVHLRQFTLTGRWR